MATVSALPVVVPLLPAVDEFDQPRQGNSSTRLTLSQLLNPALWDLPEWNGPHVEDPNNIAAQVDSIDYSVALLKRYRNSLRPVHRLSPDIMALIFLELLDDHDHPLGSTFGSCSWSYLAHVCHRWRAIALACPSIWTQISTRYPEAALTCLERSVDAPLTFVIDSRATMDNSKDVVDRVLLQMSRMRHLYIPWTLLHDDDGNVSPLVSGLIDASAPQLETFYLYRVRADGKCFALPPIFGGQTPRLTVMKLSYSYPQMGSVTFGNLKELYIRGRKRDLITLELAQLLDMLEACPVLEVLVTIKARFVHNQPLEEDDQARRQIRLDNMKRIDIARCAASVVTNLLDRLIVPNCQLRISVWLERRSDFRFTWGVPEELSENHPLRDIRKLQIAYRSGSGGVIVEGTTAKHPFQVIATIGTGSDIGDMPTVSGQLLESIAKTLDLSLLEEFTIAETSYYHPHVGFSKDVWTSVLSRMPLLRTLHIRLQSITDSGFCRVILSALTHRDDITGKLVCPLLETVTLVDDKTWSSLQWWRFAKQRRDAGHPLRRLSLCLPHYENVEDMASTDLTDLREVVDAVDLDPPDTPHVEFPSAAW
ncbi:hypothetical protein BD311DRAFT_744458 [Dichomitus squalens]|uniref:Uncharacterized protein n=1 Tax=Dichomitus squalens TaxID=114155 RepID=A0A4Q9QCR9_9APHY|nr:hypothetical protein BD311DRAFT_744458 [Dichomitus squalens]TBU65557.1 hypothetical protein BD310DRAFT_911567 [Dichomitus squalens]